VRTSLGDYNHRFVVVAEATLGVLVLVLHRELGIGALLAVSDHFSENIALSIGSFFFTFSSTCFNYKQVDRLSVAGACEELRVNLVIKLQRVDVCIGCTTAHFLERINCLSLL
jgi:hypothetical protein